MKILPSMFSLRAVVVLGILLIAFTPAYAGCSSNADCTGGNTCQVTWDFWLFKLRDCKFTLCNTDRDCPAGTTCKNGGCQGCNSSSDCPDGNVCTKGRCVPQTPQPHPAAGTVPGEGRKCMPANGSKPPDWALDSHGKPLGACPPGTVCSPTGYCVKLEP